MKEKLDFDFNISMLILTENLINFNNTILLGKIC